jgi:hypothetical protein
LRYNDDVDAKPVPDLDVSIVDGGREAELSWTSLSPKSDGTVMRYLL